MKLTQTLLGYLNRVFSKDPQRFRALRFEYAGTSMSWVVAERTLTVTVVGGIGSGFSIDLTEYTLRSLATYIAGLSGFTVTYRDQSDLVNLSATVLLDGVGNQDNPDLFGYSSVLYAYMESMSVALDQAESDVVEALRQVSIRDAAGAPSAAGYWLDEIGSYYGIPRLTDEPDAQYGPRIIAEVIRPRANNVALEAAIKVFTGQQTTVTDVAIPTFTDPLYNAEYVYDGSQLHNSEGTYKYGLFDVVAGYDLLNGGDISTFLATVEGVVNRLRDAGTHMRSLLLGGSVLTDALTPPADALSVVVVSLPLTDALTPPVDDGYSLAVAMAPLTDALTPPEEGGDDLVVDYAYLYNGLRLHNSIARYCGGHTGTGDMAGSSEVFS